MAGAHKPSSRAICGLDSSRGRPETRCGRYRQSTPPPSAHRKIGQSSQPLGQTPDPVARLARGSAAPPARDPHQCHCPQLIDLKCSLTHPPRKIVSTCPDGPKGTEALYPISLPTALTAWCRQRRRRSGLRLRWSTRPTGLPPCSAPSAASRAGAEFIARQPIRHYGIRGSGATDNRIQLTRLVSNGAAVHRRRPATSTLD